MKKLFKTLSALLVTAVAMTALTMPVAADTQYAAITGNKVTFYKTLIVDKDAKIPNLDFTFSTAGDGAVTGDPTDQNNPTITVLNGTGTIDPVTVRFNPTTAFDADNAHGVRADYKTATLPVEIDLTAATYSEPGVYRYYITEANGDSRVLYDVNAGLTEATGEGARVRTLDVYVEDTGASTPALAVTGYVMYQGKVTAAPSVGTNATNGDAVSGNVVIGESGIYVVTGGNTVTEATSAGTKTNYIMNAYKTHDLTFGKEVIGNQGSRDKYFKVRVTCTGLNDTDEFPVDMSHAEKTPTKTTATSYTAAEMAAKNNIAGDKLTGAQLKAGYDFYLQDGNYVTILGLPEGCGYEVSETAEDYTSNQKISATNSSLDWDGSAGADALNDELSGTMTADKHTGFTNEKKGVIPTGVLLVATPVIIVALIAVAGVVFFAVRSAKNRAQEDEAETAEE
ncbi:MAG: hypothetical protein VZR13_05135 [Saccharofermentanaceae bacterium]|nr:hypothetical protein [Saccharofermentanaceae bacterium]